MQYINFQDIKNEHLHGEWRRRGNVAGNSDPGSPFAMAEVHKFQESGVFKMSEGSEVTGRWSIVYSDDLVKRPYLQFDIGSSIVLALITQLKCTEDCKKGRMTLYLTSGLELDLEKD